MFERYSVYIHLILYIYSFDLLSFQNYSIGFVINVVVSLFYVLRASGSSSAVKKGM